MKTLFISDLDGTLLQSNEKISQYTCDVINWLTENGVIFSYATARSFVTAKKVTLGLNTRNPLIIYNGAFIVESSTGTVMHSNYFTNEARQIIEHLLANGIVPIVYAYIDGIEKFSFVFYKCSCGMKEFLFSRAGDIRANSVADICQLYKGDIFYITCIDEEKKLKPFYDRYKADFNCVYQRDIYSGEQWLEIMPKSTSKANAVMRLKKHLNVQKIVAFGDGKNDIDMFKIADESYAVKNAVDELKNIATGVIDTNDNDAVAKWLEKNTGIIK